MSHLSIVGAGGLASELLDLVMSAGEFDRIDFFADELPASGAIPPNLKGLTRGGIDCLREMPKGFQFVVAVGDPTLRQRLFKDCLDWGGRPQSLVHPSALVDPSSTVGAGSIIMAGVSVTSNASIGLGGVFNPGSRVSHDCVIGNFVTLGPNAVLCGRSCVGDTSLVGAGAIINPDTSVVSNVLVGAGSVVTRNITREGVWFGAPAAESCRLHPSSR